MRQWAVHGIGYGARVYLERLRKSMAYISKKLDGERRLFCREHAHKLLRGL